MSNRFDKKKALEIEPISHNFTKTNQSIKDKPQGGAAGRSEQKAQDKGFIQEWF